MGRAPVGFREQKGRRVHGLSLSNTGAAKGRILKGGKSAGNEKGMGTNVFLLGVYITEGNSRHKSERIGSTSNKFSPGLQTLVVQHERGTRECDVLKSVKGVIMSLKTWGGKEKPSP